MSAPRIALIGFGEVGQTLAEDLVAAGVTGLSAFDAQFSDPDSLPSRALATHPAVRAAESHRDAVAGADLVICAVTAAQDLTAAEAVAEGIAPGALFLDLNSASPAMKIEAARRVDGAGGRYVEAAVMSPIGPKRIASPPGRTW